MLPLGERTEMCSRLASSKRASKVQALNPFPCKHLAWLESTLPAQNLFFINGTVLRRAYALPCLSAGMDINLQLLGSWCNSLEDSNEVTRGSSFVWEFFCICPWTEEEFCNRTYLLQPCYSPGKCCAGQSGRTWQSHSEPLSLQHHQFN